MVRSLTAASAPRRRGSQPLRLVCAAARSRTRRGSRSWPGVPRRHNRAGTRPGPPVRRRPARRAPRLRSAIPPALCPCRAPARQLPGPRAGRFAAATRTGLRWAAVAGHRNRPGPGQPGGPRAPVRQCSCPSPPIRSARTAPADASSLLREARSRLDTAEAAPAMECEERSGAAVGSAPDDRGGAVLGGRTRSVRGQSAGRAYPALFCERSAPWRGRSTGSGGCSARCCSGAPGSGAAPSGGRLRPAARAPYGHIPRCPYAGDRLRLVARRLAAHGLAADCGYASDLAASLAMLTAAVADFRAAQHRAAQAAAARRAAEHLCGSVANHRPGHGPTGVSVRAPRMWPAWIFRPGSRRSCKPLQGTRHLVDHPDPGLPRFARDRRQASARSAVRALRSVAPRPDFCHLITARLDDKLMTNDLQASSNIAELACDLRELVGGTRLELVTSSVSGKRSPN